MFASEREFVCLRERFFVCERIFVYERIFVSERICQRGIVYLHLFNVYNVVYDREKERVIMSERIFLFGYLFIF